MLLLTWMETYGLLSSMPWPELIHATGTMATFKLFIDLELGKNLYESGTAVAEPLHSKEAPRNQITEVRSISRGFLGGL